ncbi:unnamed protein product [Alopecurus aequalis]
MCFEFGSCFGNGRREDYGGERSTPKTARGARGRGRRADHGNRYYSGTDYKAPAYQQQPQATALDEAGYKAYHDGARKDHYVAADAGRQGGYDIPKLPAPWHNKVSDNAGYAYTYTANLHAPAADRRENGAVDYHH